MSILPLLVFAGACKREDTAQQQPIVQDSNFAAYPEPGAPPTPENVIPGGTSQDPDVEVALINSLRNMMSAQEVYFVDHNQYAKRIEDLEFVAADSATITITEATDRAWAAYATHPRLMAGRRCAIFWGPVQAKPHPDMTEATPQCTP